MYKVGIFVHELRYHGGIDEEAAKACDGTLVLLEEAQVVFRLPPLDALGRGRSV